MKIPKEAFPNARAVARYLNVLACPCCKEEIIQSEPSRLTCGGCRRTFEVIGTIPVLLPTSAGRNRAWEKWKHLEDAFHESYKNWSEERHLAARPVYRAFYDWCGIADSQNISVLDVGGASGIHRLIYWKYPEKINYFNVDPRIFFLHRYHLQLYPNEREIDFPCIVGVGEHLPFKSNTFDLCVTTSAIDHCSSPPDVFHEIFRCLKPRKKLYIMVRKHGTSPDKEVVKEVLPRVSQYYRQRGLFAAARKMATRLALLPGLMRQSRKDTHVHHFRSLEEVTDLLPMFTVTRTKEAKEGGRSLLYIECQKE